MSGTRTTYHRLIVMDQLIIELHEIVMSVSVVMSVAAAILFPNW